MENKLTVVAIRDMSAGNESVGDMWQETKIFDGDTPVREVMEWATDGQLDTRSRKRITLTIPDTAQDKLYRNTDTGDLF